MIEIIVVFDRNLPLIGYMKEQTVVFNKMN